MWAVVKILVPVFNTRCRIIIGIQKASIVLTTTHVGFEVSMALDKEAGEGLGCKCVFTTRWH